MRKLPFNHPIDPMEVFNPNDFETIRLDIHFRNLVSGMNFKEGVSMTETGENSMVLELPAKSCNKGQNVYIDIFKKTFGKKNTEEVNTPTNQPKPILSFTGKIVEAEVLETSEIRATIKMVQFEEKEWIDFLSYFNNRQEEINNFITAVRGY